MPEWTIAATSILTIGGAAITPEFTFDRITSVRRLRDGGVALTNAGTAQVRVYAPDGALKWQAGQPGDGPGDFRSLGWIEVVAGDTLLAYDGQGTRLTWITPEGEVVRTIQAVDPTRCGRPWLGAPAPSLVILNCPLPGRRSEGVHREPRSVVVLDPLSGDTTQIVTVRGPETTYMPGSSWGSPQFGLVTAIAVRDTLVFVGTGDRFEIGVYTTGGQTLEPYRIPAGPRRPVTDSLRQFLDDEERRSVIEFARLRGQDPRSFFEGDFSRPPATRDSVPHFGRFLVDAEHNLWVGAYAVGRAPVSDWTVIDREGRMVGRVRLPRGFTLHEAGRDYVLGVWRDEDGVEQVRMYSLQRETGNLRND